jgi:hypothetical protein
MNYSFIQKFHSGWAYLALLLLLIAILNSFYGMYSKREFSVRDRKIALFGLISAHVQFLIGFILYFVSPVGSKALGNMADSALRHTSLEHPLTNILAIVLITIGWSKHKISETNTAKFRSIAVYYGIGLLLILTLIPWKRWF